MKIVNYLHSRNVYYGDMKLENLLIFRNQLVKIDDLGISIKLNNSHKSEKGFMYLYRPVGYSKGYALSYIEKGSYTTKKDLYKNDRYALYMTFKIAYIRMLRESTSNQC